MRNSFRRPTPRRVKVAPDELSHRVLLDDHLPALSRVIAGDASPDEAIATA